MFERAVGLFAVFLFLAGATVAGAAVTETALHEWQNGADSAAPSSGLIADGAGNLYGETLGAYVPCPELPPARAPIGIRAICGTVYRLKPPSKSGAPWVEQILYAFTGFDGTCCPDGGLTMDPAGNLYGTMGSIKHRGAIFELSPTKSGPWKRTIIHQFDRRGQAFGKTGTLARDAAGNLYGASALGGEGFGDVFELSPPPKPGGAWRYTELIDFNGVDGYFPEGGIALDASGALYGTTEFGGTPSIYCGDGCGLVFEVVPPVKAGPWTEKVLVKFNGTTDGAGPTGSVTFDAAGNLYSTTFLGQVGSPAAQGTVFRLTRPASPGSAWTESVLYAFGQSQNDAADPAAGVRFDAAGNLYGTTEGGGGGLQRGTAFMLSPSPSGSPPWIETVLHAFGGTGDAAFPTFDVSVGANAVYTTASAGGTSPNCPGNIPGCGLALSLSGSLR